jgi:transcriptional regulator with XRE-family HTH domain
VNISREIYPNLKLRIYTSGIRQNRLARLLGIDEAHLSRIINGFRQPSGDIREQIATILQSDPEWLFYRMQIDDENLAPELKTPVKV